MAFPQSHKTASGPIQWIPGRVYALKQIKEAVNLCPRDLDIAPHGVVQVAALSAQDGYDGNEESQDFRHPPGWEEASHQYDQQRRETACS